jgi:hypothetical protein
MGCVPNFDYDVFISYSHANDHEGWVATFRRKLEARLRERVPAGPVFYHDSHTLKRNEDLTPQLIEGVKESAVFVPIISRNYLSRPWCLKECEQFLSASRALGFEGRIFPVRYDDVSPAEFQKVLGEKVGYEFFAKSPDDQYADTLDPDSDTFKARLNTLRMEIGAKLDEMATRGSAKPKPSAGKPPEDKAPSSTIGDMPTVFLAHPGPGLGDHADQLTSFLRGFRFELIHPGDRFYEFDEFEKAFQEGLRRSDLFVQLLGRRFDPHEDEAMQSWDRWQSLQAQAAGLTILRWFNKFDKDGQLTDVNKLDADHRAFVQQPGIWDYDFQRFRQLVHDEAVRRHHDRRQTERLTNGHGSHPLVVLRAEKADQQFAEEIGKTLAANNCDWLRVPDKIGSIDDFAKECAANGMLVIYRACPYDWVLKRLQELRRFLKSEFGKRWTCGLWRAPSDEDEAVAFSVDGLMVIEPQDRQQLDAFIARLRSG